MANIIKGRNKKMKKLFSAFLLLSIFFGPASGASVVGSVNGNPITDTDITARTELMARQGKTSTINRKQAFQNIIDDYVKLEYAGKYNVKPTDKDADKELNRMGFNDLGATTRAMARLAVKADIAWQVIMARTIIPTIEVSKADLAEEKSYIAKEHGLPVEITMIRLTGVPDNIAQKLTKPSNCDAAEKMVENLGGYPQKITAMQYELAPEMREKIAGLPLLTWSKPDNGSMVLLCSEKKGKEYKNLDEIVKQNAQFKKASFVADQQLKQLRRKAVIIVNDDRYKL